MTIFTSAMLVLIFLVVLNTDRRTKRAIEGATLEIESGEPKPVCGCSHHYALHTAEGKCGATKVKTVMTERGAPRTVQTGMYGDRHTIVYDLEKWETVTVQCPCVRYVGPEPLPRYVSGE